jgi:hypothetical protein
MRITLRIDRLVLDGVAVTSPDVPRLKEILERDLARLLERRGLAPSLLDGGAFARLAGSAITPRSAPEALAEQIAGALHTAIGGSDVRPALANRRGADDGRKATRRRG